MLSSPVSDTTVAGGILMTLNDITGKLRDANQWELYLVSKFIDYLFNRRDTNERHHYSDD